MQYANSIQNTFRGTKKNQSILHINSSFFFFSQHPIGASEKQSSAETMRKWLSGALMAATLKLKEASPLWVAAAAALLRVTTMMKKALFAAFTCILAMGGAAVGITLGALKGQTTETGFVRGAEIGAITGAITAVQLLELKLDGESLSKVALLSSLMEGKVFMEWVGPAVLKAYKWQVSSNETAYREISDIYDTTEEGRGLSRNCIGRIPLNSFRSSDVVADRVCCSICLQDFEEGESTRRLPRCKHFFHVECLDAWLTRKGSCPICRDQICNESEEYYADF